jgi:hypothetical protein
MAQRDLLSALVAAAVGLGLAGPASGVDSCKVRVEKKTGLILVDAAGISGPLSFGGAPGEATTPFFNEGTCIKGAKAKGCTLADPATLAAKTPPEACTLYVDDGLAECSAWIAGCTPGPRQVLGLDSCIEVSSQPAELTGTELNLSVDCPAGMIAVSGGFGVGSFTYLANCVPYRSKRDDIDTWRASWYASGDDCAGNFFRVTAICCPQ